jgi:hypothetical protein
MYYTSRCILQEVRVEDHVVTICLKFTFQVKIKKSMTLRRNRNKKIDQFSTDRR